MPAFTHAGQLHYFCHVPKCAGTSVEELLQKEFGQLLLLDRRYLDILPEQRWSRSSPQHLTAGDLARLIPLDRFASSFAIVRDPLARTVSAYKHSWRYRGLAPGTTLERWFDEYLSLRTSYPYAFDSHPRPQVDFLLPDARIFRMEDQMDEFLGWLRDSFGLGPDIALQRENTGELRDRDAPIEKRPVSREFVAKVVDFYAKDYERFGYDPANPSVEAYDFPLLPAMLRVGKPHLRFVLQRVGYMNRRIITAWHRHGARGRHILGNTQW
ncbi:sulfotransferase family 2 domain-containing protein [Paracoccus sp. (in: a-proteobacteria)]|uniref:sulfotransferase family 2 domain-containing protein n=1 Tax=Paracoccus sp. TaxID=267 RepID=UPI003A87A8C9